MYIVWRELTIPNSTLKKFGRLFKLSGVLNSTRPATDMGSCSGNPLHCRTGDETQCDDVPRYRILVWLVI
jgi:hypothetical protein